MTKMLYAIVASATILTANTDIKPGLTDYELRCVIAIKKADLAMQVASGFSNEASNSGTATDKLMAEMAYGYWEQAEKQVGLAINYCRRWSIMSDLTSMMWEATDQLKDWAEARVKNYDVGGK